MGDADLVETVTPLFERVEILDAKRQMVETGRCLAEPAPSCALCSCSRITKAPLSGASTTVRPSECC